MPGHSTLSINHISPPHGFAPTSFSADPGAEEHTVNIYIHGISLCQCATGYLSPLDVCNLRSIRSAPACTTFSMHHALLALLHTTNMLSALRISYTHIIYSPSPPCALLQSHRWRPPRNSNVCAGRGDLAAAGSEACSGGNVRVCVCVLVDILIIGLAKARAPTPQRPPMASSLCSSGINQDLLMQAPHGQVDLQPSSPAHNKLVVAQLGSNAIHNGWHHCPPVCVPVFPLCSHTLAHLGKLSTATAGVC